MHVETYNIAEYQIWNIEKTNIHEIHCYIANLVYSKHIGSDCFILVLLMKIDRQCSFVVLNLEFGNCRFYFTTAAL